MAQADFQPTWALISKPRGYPYGPSVGKIAEIWRTNESSLYSRLSPYSNNSKNGGLLSWGSQPFYYVNIDDAGNFPNARASETQVYPLQDSIIDVQRVSKFLVSGKGITFLATQTFLQTGNAFDETRIYNPTSPIVAAGMGLTMNSARPQRFIDTSGGIGGIAQSLLGGAGSLLAGGSAINPPSSTVGRSALPTLNASTDGKGLLRGGDANRGLASFKSKWVPSQGGTSTFMSVVSGLVSGLFSNFIPDTQKNVQFRSDEGSYGIMISAGDPRFSYIGVNGNTYGFGQLWIAGAQGTSGIRKNGEYPNKPTRIFAQAQNGGTNVTFVEVTQGDLSNSNIPTVGDVGYSATPSTDANSPGYRYGDVVGVNTPNGKEFESSDVAFQYKYYADNAQRFPTKDPEAPKKDDRGNLAQSLTNILNDIKAASGGTYNTVTADGTILRNSSTQYNYTRNFQTRNPGQVPNQYQFGFLKAYRDSGVKLVSDDIAAGGNSLGLPTAGYNDTINSLGVLDTKDGDWSPFEDDIIALYFYDVVNDKYIPFRAAVKGISESGNASWEEMAFIGRADKVYSYGGFSRNLSFNIQVVISSLKELAPTWQRINYLMTMYKPSNYTQKASSTGGDLNFDRFIVPPMFMLTMGDLYRDQPILIQSVTMTIPDDAAWETLNEANSGNTWNYMANKIQSSGHLFGQVPREVELGVTVYLLEKERAVVGGANFGHAPRTEEFVEWNMDTVPDDTALTKWNKNLVVTVPGLS